MLDECCICSLPSNDGLDHEGCLMSGTIGADEVDE